MIGAVNETGSSMIIFLYLPPTGATYIKSSDVGVNANIEEFLRYGRERRIWAEPRRRGKSNAHLYCSYIAEFPGIFPFHGQSFNWPLAAYFAIYLYQRYLRVTYAYACVRGFKGCRVYLDALRFSRDQKLSPAISRDLWLALSHRCRLKLSLT